MHDSKETAGLKEENFQLNEDAVAYQSAEDELLKEGLKRSYAERFYFATRLFKIQQTLNKAVVTHYPDTLKK